MTGRGAAAALLAAAFAVSGAVALAVAAAVPIPEPAEEVPVVYDEPAAEVPLYTQLDERWGGLPYAGADLATSGCGLTCAAMAWEHLSGETCTPAALLNLVGNDFVQDGQNYIPGFCEWMREQDPGIQYTVQYEDRDRALADLAAGRLVFGSMTGRLYGGGRTYGGHVVLLTEYDGDAVTIHDPCTAYEVKITDGAFETVAWDYFISLGRI